MDDPVTQDHLQTHSSQPPTEKDSRPSKYSNLLAKSVVQLAREAQDSKKGNTNGGALAGGTRDADNNVEGGNNANNNNNERSAIFGLGAPDLFNVVREACAHQNVKWPVECQVSRRSFRNYSISL